MKTLQEENFRAVTEGLHDGKSAMETSQEENFKVVREGLHDL